VGNPTPTIPRVRYVPSPGICGRTLDLTIISLTTKILVTPEVGAEYLLFIKLASEAGLLNKRLMLSSTIRCDQIYKYELYDFGHTLLCS
jgi:hypothetical protein